MYFYGTPHIGIVVLLVEAMILRLFAVAPEPEYTRNGRSFPLNRVRRSRVHTRPRQKAGTYG